MANKAIPRAQKQRAAAQSRGVDAEGEESGSTRAVRGLWLGTAAAAVLAVALPATGLPAHYHDFADTRSWGALPNALDVLSNLPFAIMGALVLWALWRWHGALMARGKRHAAMPHLWLLVGLTGVGLLATALCSSIYHWHPHDASLCIDRVGMSIAFAGVLGLAAADRISPRAGVLLAMLVLPAALAAAWWAWQRGNMTPWAVLQGAGLVLLLVVNGLRTPPWFGVAWWVVVLAYGAAKVFELGDHAIWGMTHGLVAGHSLKHVAAALAVWPVLAATRRHLKAARQGSSLIAQMHTARAAGLGGK